MDWMTRHNQGRALRAASIAPEDHILDLGCGTGEMTVALAKKARNVIGLDSRPLFSELEASARCSRGVVFLCTGMDQLPFDDESFDWVISSNSWHRLEHREMLLYEIPRILVPGGKLIIADGCQDSLLAKLWSWRSRLRGHRLLSRKELLKDFEMGYSSVTLTRSWGGMLLVAEK